jgi:uncharacterized protein (TIGR00725 family)
MEQKENSSAVISIFGSALSTEESEQYRLAYDLGKALAGAGLTVATGGHGGVMEAVSRGASEGGGHVIGVFAQSMLRKANPWVKQRIILYDWEDRLQKLIKMGAGYVVLNGGTGTLAELAVAWEMMAKRIIPCRPLVALGEYWRPVVERITQSKEGAGSEGIVSFAPTVPAAVQALSNGIAGKK